MKHCFKFKHSHFWNSNDLQEILNITSKFHNVLYIAYMYSIFKKTDASDENSES